jgi:predicted HD phosphohydrolase
MNTPLLEERHLSFLGHLPLTRKAAAFAEEHHRGQQRLGDNAAYMLHLFEVASLLDRSGYPDHVVAGAILHDVLEDTDARRDELDAEFGREVGELVSLVSDDPAIPDEEERKDDVRERVRRADDEATVLYAADKVSKAGELRLLMAADPDNPEIEVRFARYRKSLAMLEDKISGNRLVVLLRFELEALQELPPQRSLMIEPEDANHPLVEAAAALRKELNDLQRSLGSQELFAEYSPDDERWRQVFRLRTQLQSVESLTGRLEDELYAVLFERQDEDSG